MSERLDSSSANAEELRTVAEGVLAGGVHPIDGVRKICRLRFETNEAEHEAFNSIRSIESDTDWYPFGVVRENFDQDYLRQADASIESYLQDAHEEIRSACKQILSVFFGKK